MRIAIFQWLPIFVLMTGCAAQPAVPPGGDGATIQSGADSSDRNVVGDPDIVPSDDAGAEAQPEQVAQKTDNEEVVDVDPEIVCKYEKRTGTNVIERRCYSKKQIEDMEGESKEAFRSKGRRGTFYEPLHKKDPRNRTTDPD